MLGVVPGAQRATRASTGEALRVRSASMCLSSSSWLAQRSNSTTLSGSSRLWNSSYCSQPSSCCARWAVTAAEVVGVDLSGGQLAHARRWLAGGRRPNLRFVQHDVMRLGELAEPPFDAAICLDAACYFPDREAALRGIAARLRPAGRLLLVDWCRVERPAALQRELILEPLCRYWAIADLATASGYSRWFAGAGLRIQRLDDLSDSVAPNWERGYRAALRALAEPVRLGELLRLAAGAVKQGGVVIRAAKDQFQVALLARAAADSGLLRYVSVLAERP
jgi:SAM-dependent methyltransferase